MAGIERPWLQGPFDVVQTQPNEEEAVGDVDAQIADLKAQRAGISRKWPTAGVIAGGALTTIGASHAFIECFLRLGRRLGTMTMMRIARPAGSWVASWRSGVVLLGTSGWILAKRTNERRAIDRQIEQLKNGTTARRAPSWSVGFDVGERKGVRLAWRY